MCSITIYTTAPCSPFPTSSETEFGFSLANWHLFAAYIFIMGITKSIEGKKTFQIQSWCKKTDSAPLISFEFNSLVSMIFLKEMIMTSLLFIQQMLVIQQWLF